MCSLFFLFICRSKCSFCGAPIQFCDGLTLSHAGCCSAILLSKSRCQVRWLIWRNVFIPGWTYSQTPRASAQIISVVKALLGVPVCAERRKPSFVHEVWRPRVYHQSAYAQNWIYEACKKKKETACHDCWTSKSIEAAFDTKLLFVTNRLTRPSMLLFSFF